MARRRNTSHKTIENAMGSSITFLGQANNEELFKIINFDLYREKKGNDIVAYFWDDDFDGEIYFLTKFYPVLMHKLATNNLIRVNKSVKLNNVLPAYLPKFKETWEKRFEYLMSSSTYDDEYGDEAEGSKSWYEPRKENLKVFSVAQAKVNGYC